MAQGTASRIRRGLGCHQIARTSRLRSRGRVPAESAAVDGERRQWGWSRMNFPPQLAAAVKSAPYPLVFATISGAHLYGFPSPDSDYDLRGVHVLPLREVVGLQTGPETIEKSG